MPSFDSQGRVCSRSQEHRIQFLISAACVIPALLFVLQGYISARLNGHPTRWQDVVFSGGDWLVLGALTPIPFWMGRRFPMRRLLWKRSVGVHVLGALGLSVAWASFGMILGMILRRFPAEAPLARSYLNWVLITTPFAVLIYFVMLGCVHAYGYFVEAREREADASRLAAQLAEARLGALRMQLNPHFLFNSLNAVLVLVREQNTIAASRMLELLADVLRQVLQTDRPHEVPLADELRFLERYLTIEQVRFPDRLHVEWSIEDRTRAALVPDLVMQPLVENAIRHGVARRPEAGTVAISARIAGNFLEISVQDDGAGMEQSESEVGGVGLPNTKERLRALYGDAASIAIASLPGGGTQVVLKFPYRTVRHE
jgi:two-component system LytT family sensor kinase